MDFSLLKPIFITGVYRSGTTLISRILDNHPDLSITYDSVHFMRFSHNKHNPVSNDSNFTNLVNEVHKRLTTRWKIHFDSEDVIHQIKQEGNIDYSTIYNAIMSNLLLKNSKAKIWGEKTNVCWRKIPDFLDMFPEGKTILIIRDPRDILISYKNMTYEPGLHYLDAVFAILDSFHMAQKYHDNLSSNNFHLIKYENLVKDPQTTIQNLSKFLEIDYSPIMLDANEFKDNWNKPWEGNSAFNKTIQGISEKTVGRWKNKISNVELYFVEMILREQMIHFGYDLAGISLKQNEWNELFQILNDDFIMKRYTNWLKSGQGHQSYPSDPIEKAYKEINFQDYAKP